MLTKKKELKNLKKANFDYTDPFLLTDQLTNEEVQVKNLSNAFAKQELLPKIVLQNRHEEFDKGLFQKLGKNLGTSPQLDFGTVWKIQLNGGDWTK